MGVMREVHEDDSAIALLTPGGAVKSANAQLLSLVGAEIMTEVVGKPFRAVLTAAGAALLPEILATVLRSGEEIARFLEIRTRAGRVLPASIKFAPEKSGSGGVQAQVVSLSDNVGIITIDELGAIQNANGFVSSIFGWQTKELTAMNIAQLMPRPYSRFHAQYLARFRRTGVTKVLGDARGRVVSGLHKDGRVFSLILEVQEMKDEEGGEGAAAGGKRLFSGRMILSASDAVDQRCMRVRSSQRALGGRP